MSPYIRTNISNAYWCTPSGFAQAKFPSHGTDRGSLAWEQPSHYFDILDDSQDSVRCISWFDRLFDGNGILIPRETERPITLLLSGPPGSGKTTLALELCLRVAICHGFWSLYISTESETTQLKKKAEDLGIKGIRKGISAFRKSIPEYQGLTIYGQENIQTWGTFSEILNVAIQDIATWLLGADSGLTAMFLKRFSHTEQGIPDIKPDILVFDSLNMVKAEERHEFFERIVRQKYGRTKLIIAVIDSRVDAGVHESWEFACDNIIRLDYREIRLDTTSLRDYYVRSLEVIKARYQGHVWGKQQFKIYGPRHLPAATDLQYGEQIRRDHPFREEGGVFIYPSVHFYLSQYKRRRPTLKIRPVPTPCDGLNELIEGFPEGRCTALIGCRGAHKSHLGYLHVLDRVLPNDQSQEPEAGLIVSLRDDEEMTRQHLLRILSEKRVQEMARAASGGTLAREKITEMAETSLAEVLRNGDLEILYYPPGYITADEFCHRMFMSIFRLRQHRKRITLLFNSLDQLSARFPLCAHQAIFVPAMIECLSGEEVTSVFIAVDEPGQPATHYGLLPMADLILSFERCKIRREDYYSHHGRPKGHHVPGLGDDSTINGILVEVSRFAGGQQAGSKGLLELVYSDKTPRSLIKKPGLHFKKWEFGYERVSSSVQ